MNDRAGCLRAPGRAAVAQAKAIRRVAAHATVSRVPDPPYRARPSTIRRCVNTWPLHQEWSP